MTLPIFRGRILAVIAVVAPLLVLFVYVGLRSGPLAPVAVTVATVQQQPITPALFGIGTVEARRIYNIGPTGAGRLLTLEVDVGDRVAAGQLLGRMDPVDLNHRLRAQRAQVQRSQAGHQQAVARQLYAQSQAERYLQLYTSQLSSAEVADEKRQQLDIATAALAGAKQELLRSEAELDGLISQSANLELTAPADGVVTVRSMDPGTTAVAGTTVIELIDPDSLWINVRLDQISAAGLVPGLPASIELRSRDGLAPLPGRVLRVEPRADAVTEELLAKVVFEPLPARLPAIAELAEVTIALPALAAAPTVPNAALRVYHGKPGVWQLLDGQPHFVPVVVGATDLNGLVQISAGLAGGEQVVIYSASALSEHSRIKVVDAIGGVAQ